MTKSTQVGARLNEDEADLFDEIVQRTRDRTGLQVSRSEILRLVIREYHTLILSEDGRDLE